mmetsp:Transcript_109714/g.310361  ORF Transcript_109714/g.310361 Transcript_109714/m.310361 type:complete len:238 (-) Transcript_109714:3-716(-)
MGRVVVAANRHPATPCAEAHREDRLPGADAAPEGRRQDLRQAPVARRRQPQDAVGQLLAEELGLHPVATHAGRPSRSRAVPGAVADGGRVLEVVSTDDAPLGVVLDVGAAAVQAAVMAALLPARDPLRGARGRELVGLVEVPGALRAAAAGEACQVVAGVEDHGHGLRLGPHLQVGEVVRVPVHIPVDLRHVHVLGRLPVGVGAPCQRGGGQGPGAHPTRRVRCAAISPGGHCAVAA